MLVHDTQLTTTTYTTTTWIFHTSPGGRPLINVSRFTLFSAFLSIFSVSFLCVLNCRPVSRYILRYMVTSVLKSMVCLRTVILASEIILLHSFNFPFLENVIISLFTLSLTTWFLSLYFAAFSSAFSNYSALSVVAWMLSTSISFSFTNLVSTSTSSLTQWSWSTTLSAVRISVSRLSSLPIYLWLPTLWPLNLFLYCQLSCSGWPGQTLSACSIYVYINS